MANYKSKVNFLQQHLADLLTQKKALHSRVVAEEFHKFKLTSSRVSLVSHVLLSKLIVVISAYSLDITVIIGISNSINCQNSPPQSSSNGTKPFDLFSGHQRWCNGCRGSPNSYRTGKGTEKGRTIQKREIGIHSPQERISLCKYRKDSTK